MVAQLYQVEGLLHVAVDPVDAVPVRVPAADRDGGVEGKTVRDAGFRMLLQLLHQGFQVIGVEQIVIVQKVQVIPFCPGERPVACPGPPDLSPGSLVADIQIPEFLPDHIPGCRRAVLLHNHLKIPVSLVSKADQCLTQNGRPAAGADDHRDLFPGRYPAAFEKRPLARDGIVPSDEMKILFFKLVPVLAMPVLRSLQRLSHIQKGFQQPCIGAGKALSILKCLLELPIPVLHVFFRSEFIAEIEVVHQAVNILIGLDLSLCIIAVMVDGCLRNIDQPITRGADPPREVHILPVQKEVLVEAA